MSLHRISAVTALILGALMSMGCPASPPNTGVDFQLAVAGGSTFIQPGQTFSVVVTANLISGFNSTPVKGPAVLHLAQDGGAPLVMPVNGGTFPVNVSLSSGSGLANFVMCSEGPGCQLGDVVVLTGSITANGQNNVASLALTIGGPDAGLGPTDGGVDAGVDAGPPMGAFALTLSVSNPNNPMTPLRIPAGGEAVQVVANLTQGGQAVSGETVKIGVTNNIGILSDPTNPTVTSTTFLDAITDRSGNATLLLTPESVGAAGGVLLASFNTGVDGGLGSELVAQQNLIIYAPASLSFTPATTDKYNQVMGIRSSGYQETSTLRFTLLDSTGVAYVPPVNIPPVQVSFKVPTLGGATVVPSSVVLDTNGQAVTTVQSGVAVGTLAVTATAVIQLGTSGGADGGTEAGTGSTITLTTTSPTLTVVGAKANGRNFSVTCQYHSVPALWGNDCTYMHVDVSPSCTTVIGDRFGNALGVATQVTWLSEAGLFGPPSQTTAAVAGTDPTSEPDLGRSSNTLRMLNAPLPEQNLTPLAGEPKQTITTQCGTNSFSPRDGLVTFIASTRGEEGFVDTNGNGEWDPGEVFYDQGEPYVDSNDNNQWDPGEPFIDVNGNGQYDEANGTWDADTTIWTVGFMTVTGEPISTTYDPEPLPNVNVGSAELFGIAWRDQNLNEPSAAFSTYGVVVQTPAIGSAMLESPATLVDKTGSMTITQPTECQVSPVDAGICEPAGGGAPTACDCALQTKITFDGPREEAVIYTAPAQGAGGADVIEATLAEVVGTEMITTKDNEPIQVIGSTTVVPYVLAMSVLNSDSTPFNGKYYAGDPALHAVITVTQGGVAPTTPQQVILSVSNALGVLTDASNASNAGGSITLTTDATGTARATFAPLSTVAGSGILTALFSGVATPQSVQQNVTVLLPGQLLFTPGPGFSELLGIVGSGYSDQTTATFTLNDSSGAPWAGLTPQTVHFSVPSLGGAAVTPSQVTLSAGGQASTTVNSGVAAGTLQVMATVHVQVAPATTITLNATSSTIAVVGAKANGRNFSITCDHQAVPALWNNDCTYMHVDVSPTCTAVAGDRFGNALGVATQVTWLSEAGLFGPPSQTTAASPGVDPVSEANLGRTSNSLRMLDAPLPEQNLKPFAGEPSKLITNACGTQTYSPRDGLITLIAATPGEEGFTDVNENGQWDPGEPFVDQGEPYVDSNDNNQWDPGEPFVDVNGNGAYDGPNGSWDANTIIWTTSHLVVTGTPLGSTTFSPSPFPSVAAGSVQPFLVNWMDQNLNEPAPLFTTYSTTVESPALGAVAQMSPASLVDKPGSMTIALPTTCAPSPVNGTCTIANPDCDCQVETAIAFDGTRSVQATYAAPAAATGGTDVVVATAAQTVGATALTPQVMQAIKVTASQTTNPYTLAMSVTNSNGTPFSGKFYAGDPALNVVVNVTQGGAAPASPQQVTLSLSNSVGTLTDASNASNTGATILVTTNAAGTANVTLTPVSTNPGAGVLTATFSGSSPIQTLQQSLTVVTPSQLVFTPGVAFSGLLGIAGSGYNTQTEVTFTLDDSSGAPWAGQNPVSVLFSVPTLGGAAVSPSTVPLTSAGTATATVFSGVAAGTLNVSATTHILVATGVTVTLHASSTTIAVVGAKANGKNFSITCDHEAVPALWNNDCTFMHVDVSPSCTAVIGDRFGNALGVDTQVTWLTEAGLFGPPSQTPAAAPGVDPVSEPTLGRTSNSLRMLNAPLPQQNLKPFAGEPSHVVTNSCGTATFSPRDGLVTLIAATQGEEGYTDLNGNGQWDPGESFIDEGEPYADSNDNNVWDPGEPFIDVNGNGQYDGPNGIWDANTTIWTLAHIAVTGNPTASTTFSPSPFPSVMLGQTEPFLVNWMDVNLNEPAALYTTYATSVQSPALGSVLQVSPASLTDKWGSMSIALPTTCAPSPVNGTCTIADPDCDCQLETAISFDGTRSAQAVYSAPASGAGGTDVVVATATELVGASSITPQAMQAIKVTTSTTATPYTLAMSVLNANGTTFGGKFYAGDPAIDIVLTVTQGGAAPASPQQVTLSVSNALGTLTDASNATNTGSTIIVTTNAAGTAKVTLTPVSTTPGSGVVTATYNGSTPAQTLQQAVTVVTPGQLLFTPGTSFSGLLGIAGSGYNPQTQVTFTLNDSSGAPWAGQNPQTVLFSVPTLGGAAVSPSTVTLSAAGTATSTVFSGVAAGTLNVSATTHILVATGVTVTLTGTSTTIAVVGAKANGKNFSITCDHEAVPALWNNDCTYMHVDVSPTCTAVAGDRFGNALGVGTQVTWLSEAGLFGPPSQTPSASPGVDPVSEPTLGRTTNSLRMLDAPLPAQNLTPLAGEPSHVVTNSCGTKTYSPRDGLITLIAATEGEEGFTDVNENGQWDPGEPFFDLGEPYVDSNDNNQWDQGEPFVDVNGNGKYDGPNGVWDANTTIWTASRIAVTGNPTATTTFSPSPFPSVALGGTEPFLVNWMDVNLNEPAPLYTTYATTLQAPALGAVAQLSPASITDKWGSMTISLPTTCAPSPVNGTCTVANPNCDCQVNTAISFDGTRSTQAVYSAPGSGAGGTDVIVATAVETVGSASITPQVRQAVQVTTSQTATPYTLTMNVLNASGSAFGGKFYAGDPALDVIVTVTQGGAAPATPQQVTLHVSNAIGTLTDASNATNTGTTIILTTNAGGTATATLTPVSTAPGAGVLTATYSGSTPAQTLQQDVTVVTPGQLLFTPEPSFSALLGIAGSGYTSQTPVTFTLNDSSGAAWAGENPVTVLFSVPSLGGAKVNPASVTLSAAGTATSTVSAGVAEGTLDVTATTHVLVATGVTVTLSASSSTIAVVGARANGRNFAITCDHDAVPALWNNDCSYMHVDLSPTCTAVAGDRFGNALGVATQVTWLSEAGLFGPPSQTPAASPGVDPVSEPSLGRTQNSLRMLNAPLPEQNLKPFTGEPSHVVTNSCGTQTYSPRDGLITLIAATQGEEGFVDQNANGQWDPGEPFFDEGEPYVDSNDNNQWDSGEPFIDVNGNGVYDGPNGTWDASTTIWTSSRIAVTGNPQSTTTFTPSPFPSVLLGGVQPFLVNWMDTNLNEPAPLFTTYGLSVQAPALGSVLETTPSSLLDKWGSMTITQPTTCAPSPVNGTCTVANPNCDCQIQTNIAFDGPRSTQGVYSAPVAGAGGTDLVVATASETVGSTAITPQVSQSIQVATSQTTTPYSLAMSVFNSNATAFGGKFYAGDPALSVVVTVTQGGSAPAKPQQVTLNVTNSIGVITDASNPSNKGTTVVLTTDASGTAMALLAPESTLANSGVLTSTFNGGTTPQTLQQVVTVVTPSQLVFSPSASFTALLGIAGSGYTGQTPVTFTLNDSSGSPWAGLNPVTVQFSVPKLGGAAVTPSQVTLNSSGQATSTVFSGVAAGTLAATATTSIVLAVGDTVTLTASSATIAVVGAKANGRNFAVTCDHDAVPALWNNDCTYMHVDVTPTCTAVLGDRFNNALGVATQVTWLSEAGLFGPPSQTVAAAPGVNPTSEPNLGQTQNSLRMLNAPLPKQNLAPLAGESSYTTSNGCGTNIRYSPRDGLITLIAATQGEEGFIDANGNGQWDQGETFYDQGEPYVDENDNNTWDPGEPFIDVNGNGSWDGPNGAWDANTTIWSVAHLVATGDPTATSTFTPAPFSPLVVGEAEQFLVSWMDENLNEPAPLFTTYGLSLRSPALGTVAQTSPANLTDKWGSMTIQQPTVCTSSPSACTVANPNCDCQLETSITFDGPRVTTGIYDAPANGNGGSDTVIATATETVGSASITPEIMQSVSVAATQSQNNSPYAIALKLEYSSGVTNTTGKYSAGDPPLTVIATLTQGGAVPASPQKVTLSVTNAIGTLTDASNSMNTGTTIVVTTDVLGNATAQLAPESIAANQGLLTATFSDASTGNQIVQQQLITVVIPAQLTFTPGSNFTQLMGVAGSGYNQESYADFTLLDSSGAPWTSVNPVTVTFSVPNVGGSYVSPTTITLDQTGQASTVVYSGVAAGTLAVTASTTVTLTSNPLHTVSLSVTSSTIAIVGAKANGKNLSLSCSPEALPALWGNDCSFMHADQTATCTVVIGDRYGNTLGVATQVSWLTEAGLFGPPSSTTAATPGADPTGEPTLGRTSNTLRTLNSVLPEQNLTPFAGEPSRSHNDNGCGVKTHSPRDGLITLIAATQGEEGFIDENANGQWDPGEPFFDQGEPYVDSNDNNQWDPGEPFIDVNGNNSYDGPNGEWDANTTIWTVGHVAVTDEPSDLSTLSVFGTAPLGGSLDFTATFEDGNFNETAPSFTSYGVGVLPVALGSATLLSPSTGSFTDRWGSMKITYPTSCGPSPVNGVCTVANPNCDCELNTSITFPGARSVVGVYVAPSQCPATAPSMSYLTDTVFASDTETIGSGSVVDDVTGSISSGPCP